MLAAKLAAFEAAVAGKTAPSWALDLDTEFLTILKNLGNGSIHPNGGDVTKQAALDTELVHDVTKLFSYLLYVAYEAPQKKAVMKASLSAKAKIVSK